jgi:uncharacterized delta-60 repeat protein
VDLGAIPGGRATSGSSTSLADSGRPETADDYFNGWTIRIIAGAGAGKEATVTDYTGATRTFTFADLSVTLDSTSKYVLYKASDGLGTAYGYNDAGYLASVTDPRGIEDRTEYDDLGRVSRTIEAWVDGTPSDADDRITAYGYNAEDQLVTLTADLAGNDQVTTYTYGVDSTSGGGGYAYAIAIQPWDGKIIVAGISGSDFAVARYNSDGTLDSSFDTDGKLTLNMGGTDQVNAIAIQPDGKILLVGNSGSSLAIARLTSSGALDYPVQHRWQGHHRQRHRQRGRHPAHRRQDRGGRRQRQ